MPVRGPAFCTLREAAPYTEIEITKGYRLMISPEDAWWVEQHSWSAKVDPHTVYARRTMRVEGLGRVTSYVHREIVTRLTGKPIPDGYLVDHINHVGLDCRRSNLRFSDPHANTLHSVSFGVVPFRGVVLDGKRYRARIKHPLTGDRVYIGTHNTAEEAARAYDLKALEILGVFATLNFNLDQYENEIDLSALALHKDKRYDIPF